METKALKCDCQERMNKKREEYTKEVQNYMNKYKSATEQEKVAYQRWIDRQLGAIQFIDTFNI